MNKLVKTGNEGWIKQIRIMSLLHVFSMLSGLSHLVLET